MSRGERLCDKVRVELGPRSYDILVGGDLLQEAGELIGPVLRQPRVVVVTDERVAGLHLGTLQTALDRAGISHAHVILPAGEGSKNFQCLEELIDELLTSRVERGTTLIALGGGAIGDITGFAASIILRGIDFVQVPTTLLAQVDSAVGGKTGINTWHGKNLVGSFYQPRFVLADTSALASLPDRELRAGYAEVVKYGLIDQVAFFAWLEANGAQLLGGDDAARRQAVVTSCGAKARIVAADERESGRRALLNFGHTFGHALEAACGYDTSILHGEAVAAGMVLAFDLSVRLGICPAEDAVRVRNHLSTVGLATDLGRLGSGNWNSDKLIEHMEKDKKVQDGRITFVLTRGIGKAFLAQNVRPADVRNLLDGAIAA